MPVVAITPDYNFEAKDCLKNFHGNQIVYVGWDHHLMFCSAFAYPLPPTTTFSDLIDKVIPEGFGLHPEYSQINWETTSWLLDNKPFKPQLDKNLEDQGISHKSLLRFQTPELKGYKNAGV